MHPDRLGMAKALHEEFGRPWPESGCKTCLRRADIAWDEALKRLGKTPLPTQRLDLALAAKRREMLEDRE